MNYAESWAPADEDQAKYLIDTTNDGEDFWRVGREAAERVMQYAPAGAQCVVDYGCGIGRVIGEVNVPHPYGVDVSRQMLDLGKIKYPKVSFIVCDGASIPLRAQSVEFVYSLLALQHMDAQDVISTVRDIRRVLTHGGSTYLSFSAFGCDWTEKTILARGPLRWSGSRIGSVSSAHGAIAYTESIIEKIAEDALLNVQDILHEVLDSYHHNYILVASK